MMSMTIDRKNRTNLDMMLGISFMARSNAICIIFTACFLCTSTTSSFVPVLVPSRQSTEGSFIIQQRCLWGNNGNSHKKNCMKTNQRWVGPYYQRKRKYGVDSFKKLFMVENDSDVKSETEEIKIKGELLNLISSTPSNAPTPKSITNEILRLVKELEDVQLDGGDDSNVLQQLGGSWELQWTAQDQSSEEWGQGPFRTWINPLENQSYSNNPSSASGRSNPFLPRPVQDRLEDIGLISKDNVPVRSTQVIDLKKGQVRNVVSFMVPSPGGSRRLTLTVTVKFEPNQTDKRRIDVKFFSCRVIVNDSPIDFTIPLGPIGPTGWLRTGYIDDTIRITRGHKGSVFVLTRGSITK